LIGADSPSAVTSPFHPLLIPLKLRPFAPAEFCCLSSLHYYDRIRLPLSSIPLRFLIGIVSYWSFDSVKRRVSQVALSSFPTCRL
jgi:hypothetical protein